MCGFCGFTSDKRFNSDVIKEMMDRIIHRGPDSDGVFESERVSLGFRRLSFIDLEKGGQPIFNEDESLVIVFNGEIYNYRSLREELVLKGHVFRTHADTEVVLHLYEEIGVRIFERLRGMFAFVIYDRNKDEVFAARDFFGIKPFYYTEIDGALVFGSEIKSILAYGDKLGKNMRRVNRQALEHYLSFQYSVLPETFFEGIYKLMPGNYMMFKDGKLKIRRYFSVDFEEKAMTEDEAVERIEAVVKDSVEMHKISDVEVGSFLSSGVDSSFIASLFGGNKTFTVGFDYDNYNEISYAKTLSDSIGMENISKTITTDEYWGALKDVIYHMDEPLADPSAVALYFVSQTASKHVKAALSGEGADEFFGGYNIYREPISLRALTRLPKPIRKLLGTLASLIPFDIRGKNFFIRGSKDVSERFIGNAHIFTKKERDKILKQSTCVSAHELLQPLYEQAQAYDDITKMQYVDIHTWLLGDILLKADKMSMANSLEVRVPLIDREVFALARTLPLNLRVGEQTKLAFRKAANKHLPKAVAEKKKLGFPVPIRVWLREDKYASIVRMAFQSKAAEEFFDTSKLIKLLDQHKSGKKDNSRKIWTVYIFLLWHSIFIGGTYEKRK